MAKFEIPKAVAIINVLKLDGNVASVRYSTMEEFYSALIRANYQNKRKTYKEFGELEVVDGVTTVWVVVKTTEEVKE